MSATPIAWITGKCIVSVKGGVWVAGNQLNTTTITRPLSRERPR